MIRLARQKRNYSPYINATSADRYLGHVHAKRLGNVKIGAASIGFTTLGNVNKTAPREMLEVAHDLTPADSW